MVTSVKKVLKRIHAKFLIQAFVETFTFEMAQFMIGGIDSWLHF